MMDILDGFQKLVSTDREISISIGLDCRDPQAYFLFVSHNLVQRKTQNFCMKLPKFPPMPIRSQMTQFNFSSSYPFDIESLFDGMFRSIH
jgi:hypothetical protein